MATASQGAMQVTGELTELVTEASQNTLAANPLIGLQPRDIVERGQVAAKGHRIVAPAGDRPPEGVRQ